VTSHQKGGIFREALLLTAVIAAAWALAFWPAQMMGGAETIVWMSVAAVTCLVPGWVVLALSFLAVFPNDLSAMLVQSMTRLGSVAVVAVVIRKQWPHLGIADFFGWLIGFYLLALLAEVLLLRRTVEGSRNTNGE